MSPRLSLYTYEQMFDSTDELIWDIVLSSSHLAVANISRQFFFYFQSHDFIVVMAVVKWKDSRNKGPDTKSITNKNNTLNVRVQPYVWYKLKCVDLVNFSEV